MGKLIFVYSIAFAISLGIGLFVANLFNNPPLLYAIITVLLFPLVKPIVSLPFLSGELFRNKVSSMESVELIAALGGHDPKLREKAVRELRKRAPETQGRAKKISMIDILVNALKNEESGVRREAAEALGKQGWEPGDNTEKIDYLIAKQKWDELVKMGKPAVDPLINALKDKDSGIQGRAAEILGKIKDHRAIESLITALKDKDSGVQGRAAEALGEIGKPDAVEPLITALKDKDPSVRWEAAEALGEITEQNFGEDQEKWQQWWDENKDEMLESR